MMKHQIGLVFISSLSVFHDANGFSGCVCISSHKSTIISSRQMVPTGMEDTILTRSQALAYPLGFLAAFRTGAAISVVNQPRMPPIDGVVGSSVWRLPSGTRLKLFYPAQSSDTDVPMAPGFDWVLSFY
jgi:hypothetical protein